MAENHLELTESMGRVSAVAVPAAVIGLAIGIWSERTLRGERFRKVVLLLVLAMSLRLIFGG